MSLYRDSYYTQYAQAVNDRLVPADITALLAQEDNWLGQAEQAMPQAQFDAAHAQWSIWQSDNTPGYRLLAYYDNFGGVNSDEPMVLSPAIGWKRSDNDPAMATLFAKVTNALDPQGMGASATGTTSSGFGAVGMLAIAAAAYFLLFKKK